MVNNTNMSSFYFESKLHESITYRKFSPEPLGALDRKFYCVKAKHKERTTTNSTVRVSSNFLIIERESMQFNLVNLYLDSDGARSVTLRQRGFLLVLEFSNESDAATFKTACDTFVIRNNIWQSYFSMRELDKGGFSTVKLARKYNSYTDLYAIKEMSKESMDEKARKYLENELFALRNLRNENALKLFEIYEDNTSIYLITEYLNGGTLERKIKSKDINEETIKEVLSSVLSVIVELNKYNIVHRDIKPANIMFTVNRSNKESCKLIDFGLCADLLDHSSNSLLKDKSGTVCYLAPELIGWDIINKFYNEQVDVFSLGMILYEM